MRVIERVPGSCWRPYSDLSPFNREITPRPRLTARSSRIVRRVVAFGQGPRFEGGIAGTRDDWGHPVYFSSRSNPMYKVHCSRSSGWGACEVEGDRVRIPDAAQPAGGGDGHMAVIDRASGWEYDFWQVKQKPAGGGTLTVSYGGKTRVKGRDAMGLGSGATAAGFGLAAGVIRPEEMAGGKISHALFMVVECTSGRVVWPATPGSTGRVCSSIGLSNADAPSMGQRFFLDMDAAQIDALPNPDLAEDDPARDVLSTGCMWEIPAAWAGGSSSSPAPATRASGTPTPGQASAGNSACPSGTAPATGKSGTSSTSATR